MSDLKRLVRACVVDGRSLCSCYLCFGLCLRQTSNRDFARLLSIRRVWAEVWGHSCPSTEACDESRDSWSEYRTLCENYSFDVV
jgi:hypothetical protein